MLTVEQIAYFKAFGFLVFRGMFSQDETQVISREADDILTEGRDGQPFAGERQIVMAFVERRPFLASLVDDDRTTFRLRTCLARTSIGSAETAISMSVIPSGIPTVSLSLLNTDIPESRWRFISTRSPRALDVCGLYLVPIDRRGMRTLSS